MRRITVPVPALVAAVALIAAGCGATIAHSYSGPSPKDARKHAVEDRADAFNRAVKAFPDPGKELTNFPLRQALIEMTKREDKANHPWYVYVLGDNGNAVGYYVAKWPPINSCIFLSSTEDVYSSSNGNLKMQSPSYDGVYYGNAQCDGWVIFDAITNAEIKIIGVKIYTADQPLKIDAEPIKVR